MSRREVTRRVSDGTLLKIRSGWYGRPDLTPDQIAAARVGGRVTCLSWARHRGLWIPPTADRLVHVAVATNTGLSTRAVLPHLVSDTPALIRSTERTLDGTTSAIRHLALCQPANIAYAIVESALRDGALSPEEWRAVLATLPARLRLLLGPAARLSGSGSESEFAFRARAIGVPFRQQVIIGTDRVDFLLADGRIVEIDSRAFHDQLRDHRRDARTRALGRETLRFSYDQVWFEWSSIVAALLG